MILRLLAAPVVVDAGAIKDTYTLEYDWADDDTSVSWTLTEGGMLKARASGSDFASPAVLQAYESTHRRATLPLYLATHAVAKLYTSESLPSRVLRDAFLGIGQRLTPFKRLVAASLTGAH